jgi:uncharacterized membrane protein
MANLIVIAYDSPDTANEVLETLARLQKEQTIELADAVIVTRDDKGKVKLHQSVSTTGAGAAGGALWGGVIGLLFLAPFLGMAMGAAAGAAGGAGTDFGIDDNMMKELGEKLEPGGALLVLLVIKSTADKVIPEVKGYGGHLVQSSLSSEREQELRAALERVPAGA